MTNPDYWKKYYVIGTDADKIEKSIKLEKFLSEGESFELVCFKKNKTTPNILISPGSAGHSYVFAELGYQMHIRGYNVFIMPKHGGVTITKLMQRHTDTIRFIAANYNDRIGVFAEGLGGYACFYLALANGSMKSSVYMKCTGNHDGEKVSGCLDAGKRWCKKKKDDASLRKIYI